jgi:hypothetical protein
MILRKLRKVFTRPGSQDSDEELRFHLEKEVDWPQACPPMRPADRR